MPPGRPDRRRLGFTLAEVVISLAVVGLAVVSVIAILPAGMKAARTTRYQIFASTAAMTVIHALYAYSNDYSRAPWTLKFEDLLVQPTPNPSLWLGAGGWTNPSEGTTYCKMLRIGEVPQQVVARLDSQQDATGADELQRICVTNNTPLYYFYYGNHVDSANSPLRELVFTVDRESPSTGGDAAAASPKFRKLIFYAVHWQSYSDANTGSYHSPELDPTGPGYPVLTANSQIFVSGAATPPRMRAQSIARFMFYDPNTP